MASPILERTIIHDKVTIYPNELTNKLDECILKKCKENLEGKCTPLGFIKEIISIYEKDENPRVCDSGTGECIIKVKLEVLRCLPKIGQVIECKILADDDHTGAYIGLQEPLFLSILDTPAKLHVDDSVLVKINDFQIKHGDSIINVVSSFVKKIS